MFPIILTKIVILHPPFEIVYFKMVRKQNSFLALNLKSTFEIYLEIHKRPSIPDLQSLINPL